ncbi:hypothetical protein [Azospirillum sp. TSO35-2]|uniref:hypothetical protein n=1 Tax=Azospirillum sp. TSO35-2 TaxID=716796 RepID=UPI000D611192|nr:hypothetical protein [Azospirillum sp. TSO35-2]PWC37783.1 hypothetical protein TSO352_09905 [Azospirillum sp. TSO35-2]
MASLTRVLLAGALACALPLAAQAASTQCVTINGHSICSQSGEATTCQTINGRTHCLTGPGTMRCETVNGQTTCSATPGPSLRSLPALPDDGLNDPDLWSDDDDEPAVRGHRGPRTD